MKAPLKITLAIFLMAGNLLAGCLAKIYDFKPLNTYSCKFSKNYAGLKVSVDPFFEEDRLNKYFGDDLLIYNVLPIFINFENQNAEDGFIVIKEQCLLVMKELNPEDNKKLGHNSGQRMEGVDPYQLPSAAKVDNVMGASFLLGGIIGLGIAESHYINLVSKKQNLAEKQLVDKIVYPGSSHNGFIYFKINQKEYIHNIGGLLLAAKNIRTNEMINIVVDMK
jgi:hypothetical protein